MSEHTNHKIPTELRELYIDYQKHPPTMVSNAFLLHKEEQHLRDLQHEEKLLQREERAHLEALKVLQHDLKQIRLCIERNELKYKSLLHSNHHHYHHQKEHTMKIDTFGNKKRIQSSPSMLHVIHYPDIQKEETTTSLLQKSPLSPTIIPSPSESNSNAIASPTRFILPPKQPPTIFPMMPRSSKGPPMKTCTSCKHSIHRNAPVCPICKSKSHSKNPKKRKASE